MNAGDFMTGLSVAAPLIEQIAKYAAGEGPRPPSLDQLPEISEARKAQLDAMAAARRAAKS